MTRSLSPFWTLFILTGLNRESQRDSVTQPSGCEARATLGLVGHSLPAPTGLQHRRVMVDATPLGLKRFSVSFPRVARASQPWAKRRNPVGIREAGHKFLRNESRFQNLVAAEVTRLKHSEDQSLLTSAARVLKEPHDTPQQRPRCVGGSIPHHAGSETGAPKLRRLGFPWALVIGPWSL